MLSIVLVKFASSDEIAFIFSVSALLLATVSLILASALKILKQWLFFVYS